MKSNRVLLALLLLLMTSSVTSASINQFAGKWKNADANTAGLTTIEIEVKGKSVGIRAWGKCHPSDCFWGYARGTAYAASVQSNLADDAQAISTIYLMSFSQIILIIRSVEDGQIEVEVLTNFTDQSGRANTREVERFVSLPSNTAIGSVCCQYCHSWTNRLDKAD